MTRLTSMRYRLRNTALLAFAAISALLMILSLAGQDGPSAEAAGGEAKAEVVGEATLVSGALDSLSVTSKGGRERPLRQGDTLRLGDVIDPDPGAVATLELKIPRGVSDDRELVFVKPDAGELHSVTLVRTGKRETTVTIGD